MSSQVGVAEPLGAAKKRKERAEPSKLEPARQADEKKTALSGGWLLAGYLAHEFLTRGTLLSKKFEPVRSDRLNSVQNVSKPESSKPVKAYAEVSTLLMKPNGAHIPGVVNPTQLAGWLQM